MIINFGTIIIETSETVYIPGEDTFFLEDSLKELVRSNSVPTDVSKIAEMGVGSGYITIILMKLFPECLFYAIDKNQKALDCTSNNIQLNELAHVQIEFFLSDLFQTVNADTFDIIIFNPPYLPMEENSSLATTDPLYRSTWEGGTDLIIDFLHSSEKYLSQNGEIIMVLSQYQVKDGNIDDFVSETNTSLKVKEFFKKQISLETLYVVVLSRTHST